MKRVVIGRPTVIGDIKIVPMERVTLYRGGSGDKLFVYAAKEPLGVVIESPKGRLTFDIYGRELNGDVHSGDTGSMWKP